MNCPRCKGSMAQDVDRLVCVICGHSKWSGFSLRNPTKDDQKNVPDNDPMAKGATSEY